MTITATSEPQVRAASPRRAMVAGAVAALAGLASAELFGLILPGRTSAVSDVADRVISSAPDGVREWLIGVVGTHDKPLLVVGIVLVVVAGGALVGRLCHARPAYSPWVWWLGGVVAFLVAWNGTTADLLAVGLVVAVGVTVAVLVWGQLSTRLGAAVPPGDTSAADVDRRTLLRAAVLVTAASAVGLGLVALARRGTVAAVDAARTTLHLPRPTSRAPALPAGIEAAVPGIAPAITPNADFYQIDVSLSPPAVDVDTWSFTIGGRVDTARTLTYADLLALPSIERYVTLTCVSNEVGGDLVGTARWQGVRLTDLLKTVGVHADADLVVGESVDGFTTGFPRAILDDGRDAMVAYAMNGEPLPVRHGFPARLVVPGLYGYVSATKWLSAITLTTLEETVPFWVQRGWTADGRIEAASRIDVPRTGVRLAAGRVAVGGRAWHQHTGVGSVEVKVDDGAWQQATLADPISSDTWRLWSWQWDAVAGSHTLTVRMHDTNGTPQSTDEHPVFPGASSGLHAISVDVA